MSLSIDGRVHVILLHYSVFARYKFLEKINSSVRIRQSILVKQSAFLSFKFRRSCVVHSSDTFQRICNCYCDVIHHSHSIYFKSIFQYFLSNSVFIRKKRKQNSIHDVVSSKEKVHFGNAKNIP